MAVSADESKEIMKIYEELWRKIKDLIRLITNSSQDLNEIHEDQIKCR